MRFRRTLADPFFFFLFLFRVPQELLLVCTRPVQTERNRGKEGWRIHCCRLLNRRAITLSLSPLSVAGWPRGATYLCCRKPWVLSGCLTAWLFDRESSEEGEEELLRPDLAERQRAGINCSRVLGVNSLLTALIKPLLAPRAVWPAASLVHTANCGIDTLHDTVNLAQREAKELNPAWSRLTKSTVSYSARSGNLAFPCFSMHCAIKRKPFWKRENRKWK